MISSAVFRLAKPRDVGPVALLAAALLLGQVGATFADEATVSIDNFAFMPDVLTVKAGTTVTFVNHDDIPHLVVASDGKYRSQALDTNDKFSIAFDKPGDYAYYCGLHPHMKGKIVVGP